MPRHYTSNDLRMSVPEVSDLLGFDQETVRQALERGEIPGHKIGRQWFIPRRGFERMLDGDWKPEREPQIVKVVHMEGKAA